MHLNKYALHKKGWKTEEIEHASAIVGKTSGTSYWILLIIAVLGNFLISSALLPLMLILNSYAMLLLLGIMGLIMGILITGVIRGMDLHLHHHTVILFIVPVIAFISFFFLVNMANIMAIQSHLPLYHNPGIAGFVYIIGFLLPYLQFLAEKHLAP